MVTHCRDAKSDHLKNLEDMILTDEKPADSSNQDNNDEDDENEQPVALLGEL